MKRALDFTEGSEELPPAKVLCQRDPFHDSMASSSSSFPSSSISSTSKWTYDVFLSFSGEDTRNTATDFVYYAFEEKGIKTFKDDINLERGKTIKPELLKAIKESKFAVVILSKNYAFSTWCLDELVEIIDCAKKMEITVLPIFYNVDPSDVRNQIGTFALVEHEKQSKEKVKTWKAALSHVANIAGYHVKDSPLSRDVKSIVGLISRKLSGEFSDAIEGYVGIESPMLELASYLASESKDEVRIIGLWAMGGMGKTTLAKVAYKMFSKGFEACCFIGNVREKYEKEGELSLQKDLVSQILDDAHLILKNECEGEHTIKSRFRARRVLLVLDDVNDLNQLENLGGTGEWFGPGSRIIITTRDKHLLEVLEGQICEVKALSYEDALCLFYSRAFKKKHAPDEYLELSNGILAYVNGVPLALVTLGSFLFGRSADEWKNALERLKKEPDEIVNQALRISFDGLLESEQEIFLDIACLFNHEVEDHVVEVLENLGRLPRIGLKILIEKSLLKIFENNELWMHDLLRDMGRDIVRKKSRDEPGEWSRLWDYEDIDRVLRNDTGTEKVQAMDIRGVEACWRGFTFSKKQKRPLWNPKAFLKMSKLKFLRVCNVFPQDDPKHLPRSLRYLEWSGYLAKSLPSFQSNELVRLRLRHSKIEFLWEGMKNFDKLKSIDMTGSSNLIKAPNFNGVPELEELVLEECSKLRTLDPSIGKLKNLKLLNLKKCQDLTSLPNKFECISLVTLDLTGCSKVNKIPEFVGNMEHLQELLLEGTAITELPSSVQCLTGLSTLILRNCKNLVRLPNIICSLPLLNYLDLFGCSKFDKLPKDLGNITSLEVLVLSGTAIMELPSSIGFLTGLEELILEDCKKFVLLPSTVCSLKSLKVMYLSRCPKFVNLPENLGNLEHLTELCLKGTAIEVLPSSVGNLAALVVLNLKYCKNLLCLPSTICNLKRVRQLKLAGCLKFTHLPENLGNMESLIDLYLGGTALKELPSSTIHLKLDMYRLSFWGCQLSSSSLTYMPGGCYIDLSDCNISAIPSGIYRNLSETNLYLSGNDFVSLPDGISQLSGLRSLYLDGCKSLRSLSNIQIPSTVQFICVDNCSSLERLPEAPEPRNDSVPQILTVQCFNCFKLAENFQYFRNMFQGQRSQQYRICCIIPGRQIPKWFKEVNICDTSVYICRTHDKTYDTKKVKIQLPGSGCDEWTGIVLCVVFLPIQLHHRCQLDRRYRFPDMDLLGREIRVNYSTNYTYPVFVSKYGEVESHHLWLHSVHKNCFRLPKTAGRSVDKGFHQIELEIQTRGFKVEKIGFCVV